MARLSKRIFRNQIAEIIGKNMANLNAISHSSGISHTYLTKLVKGQINRPGKDKIASILLGLNYPITKINAILAGYDYLPLDIPDIPAILENNKQRKLDNTTLPLYDRIYVRLLLASMEQVGGSKILSRNTPSALFMPDELYHREDAFYDSDNQGRPFYQAFSQALFNQRKGYFLEAIRQKKTRFETYICKSCLEDYINQQMTTGPETPGNRRQELIVQFFANAVSFIRRQPQQHITSICDHCSYFIYQIQGAELKQPTVFYLGKTTHSAGRGQERLRLQGFTSANPNKVELFRHETQLSRQTIVEELMEDYPNRLVAYIGGLFAARGWGRQFEQAVDHLLATGGMY